MIATVVDVGALWQTVWTAAVAGLLVTVCCSFAVLGAARAQELRATPDGAPGPWILLGVAGALAMTVVVVYGLLLVVNK